MISLISTNFQAKKHYDKNSFSYPAKTKQTLTSDTTSFSGIELKTPKTFVENLMEWAKLKYVNLRYPKEKYNELASKIETNNNYISVIRKSERSEYDVLSLLEKNYQLMKKILQKNDPERRECLDQVIEILDNEISSYKKLEINTDTDIQRNPEDKFYIPTKVRVLNIDLLLKKKVLYLSEKYGKRHPLTIATKEEIKQRSNHK